MSRPTKTIRELQTDLDATWAALVAASFGISNAVRAQASRDDMKEVEIALGRAAIEYAAAQTAMVEAVRPPLPRRTRRR